MPVFNTQNAVRRGVPPIEYGSYRLHVKKATFGASKSSNNPMITLNCEIVSPDRITRFGQEYMVAGTEVMYWIVLTENNAARAADLFQKLGLSEQLGQIDTDDTTGTQAAVNQAFDRLMFDALLWSEEDVKRQRQTPEQKAKNQPGDPILDSTGKEIKLGYKIQAPLDSIVGNPEYAAF